MNLWPDREFQSVPPRLRRVRGGQYGQEGEETKILERRGQESGPCNEEAQGRHATQWSFGQEGQEPQASHRDRSLRGAQARRSGTEEEEILARGLRRVRRR